MKILESMSVGDYYLEVLAFRKYNQELEEAHKKAEKNAKPKKNN